MEGYSRTVASLLSGRMMRLAGLVGLLAAIAPPNRRGSELCCRSLESEAILRHCVRVGQLFLLILISDRTALRRRYPQEKRFGDGAQRLAPMPAGCVLWGVVSCVARARVLGLLADEG